MDRKFALISCLLLAAICASVIFAALEIRGLARLLASGAPAGDTSPDLGHHEVFDSIRDELRGIRESLATRSERNVIRQSGTSPEVRADKRPTAKPGEFVRPQRPRPLQSGLTALERVLRDIDKRPIVARASIPRNAEATPMNAAAANKTLSAVRNSAAARSRLLLRTPEQLIRDYGKPPHISVDDKGKVRWWYQLQGTALIFVLYDGRVIAVEWS